MLQLAFFGTQFKKLCPCAGRHNEAFGRPTRVASLVHEEYLEMVSYKIMLRLAGLDIYPYEMSPFGLGFTCSCRPYHTINQVQILW